MSRLEHWRAGLAHAFAVEPDAPLDDSDDDIVDRLARLVVRRRLTTPALLALESSRPLAFLGSQVVAFFGPLLSLVFSRTDVQRFVGILERRGSIDLLIDAITDRENDRLE